MSRRSETYSAVHRRLQAVRGKAAEHRCADCGEPAREWSYSPSGPDPFARVGPRADRSSLLAYSLDLSTYVARCRPCHHRLDHGERLTCLHGHRLATQGGRCPECAAEQAALAARRTELMRQARAMTGLTYRAFTARFGGSVQAAEAVIAQHERATS